MRCDEAKWVMEGRKLQVLLDWGKFDSLNPEA